MGVSRQEYWSVLPFPPPGDLPNPEIELTSLVFPALGGVFFTTGATWEVQFFVYYALDVEYRSTDTCDSVSFSSDIF